MKSSTYVLLVFQQDYIQIDIYLDACVCVRSVLCQAALGTLCCVFLRVRVGSVAVYRCSFWLPETPIVC